eukprot:CAMPEP_0195289138 /NCGR_PEP_ID=MMETSP0707-20130614/5540_1 /TAXON_ID=33640 /ORGANISM="Asterionellopsis glacialis, Strain CCMP134" /LENGTH=955 /DNA_ID=CAMNT_0040349109 /DNA_START=132 /DNA_END=2999 /DNA_ORIENTATION=+
MFISTVWTFLASLILVRGAMAAAANGEEPLIPRACAPPHADHEFCDATLPLDVRLNKLIDQLTLEEKTILLVARESPQGNISRLGIPEYDWGGNCVHGVQSRCTDDGKCPTSFPNPNTLGATFNSTVWKSMGSVIGLELRALWLQGVGENHDSNLPHMGLDCWSPNVGIQRDPRWGRNHETPSEDPFLCGQFGTHYTLGLQNNSMDTRFLQAVATLKHFDANSLEGNWYPDGTYGEDGPLTRHSVDPPISPYDLHSSYYPAFKASVVQGGAAGVMCSYNAINGVPSCANHDMLHDTLRGEWNFRGYVTSDTGAIKDILTDHKYTTTWKQTVAVALNATCDIQSAVPSTPHHPWETGGEYITYIPDALEDHLLEEETVNEALRNSLGIRFRLGLFDPIDDQPFWHVPPDVIQSDAHTKIATDATAQGFVLLQDDTSLLPLDPQAHVKIAVIGPFAKDHSTMIGDYLGQICPIGWNGINLKGHSKDCVPTFYMGLETLLQTEDVQGELTYVKGCDVHGDSKDEFAAAVEAAQNADVVLFLGGLDGTIEIEGLDRPSVGLPQIQVDLLQELATVNSQIILPLLHGGIVGLDDVVDHVPCIISMGNPGRFAAHALAEALFGLTARAWGKTPVTWYKSTIVDELNMVDFDMSKSPGRTYRYYTGEPAFPFGHGLNPLTTFEVQLVDGEDAAAVFSDHGRTDFTLKVTNVGERDGDEVIMVYFKPLEGVVPSDEPASRLQKQLFDFQRVSLKPNESTMLSFHVGIPKIQLHNHQGKATTFHGDYEIEFTNGNGATSTITFSTDAPPPPPPSDPTTGTAAPSMGPTTGTPTTFVEHIVQEEIGDFISARNIIIASLFLFAVVMITTFCILRRIRENPDGRTARVCQRMTYVCCCACRCLCCCCCKRGGQHKHEQLATDYDGVFAMEEAGQDSFEEDDDDDDDDNHHEMEDGVIVTREEDEIL